MEWMIGVFSAGEQHLRAFSELKRRNCGTVWRISREDELWKHTRWRENGGWTEYKQKKKFRSTAICFFVLSLSGSESTVALSESSDSTADMSLRWLPSGNSVLWLSPRGVTGTLFPSASVFGVPCLRPCDSFASEETRYFCRNATDPAWRIPGSR